MKTLAIIGLFLLCALAPNAAPLYAAQPTLKLAQFQKRPRLVVVIVLDQFRADYLTRFEKQFTAGGFRYLMSNGAYFPAARYDVLQNMTCPGHAMILTGSYPYRSGIALNYWYDHDSAKMRYCADDEKDGLSPRMMIGTTVGDELKNAGYQSKVIALALKDRSAIALGGHRADLSFWLGADGLWTTSTYYAKAKALPNWLLEINKELEKARGQELKWSATGDGAFTRTALAGSADSLLLPYGVELTTDAALAAIKGGKLGSSGATDLLAVSYSTHDLLGHKTGPNSREMKEMTLAEDRSIARLINGIRGSVPGGLKDVVFALTADHGVSPDADYLAAARIDAGRIDVTALVEAVNKELNGAYGKPKVGERWMVAEESFNFYLNRSALEDERLAKGVTRDAVEQTAKKVLLRNRGAMHVFTRTEVERGTLPPGEFRRQIGKSYLPGRSGDLILIPKPFYTELSHNFATHVTGYTYDSNVPLIIAGPNIEAGVYASPADIIDLAPTLAFLNGTTAPAQAEGRILNEIFKAK